MKRSTKWIIVVCTAILTTAGLHATVGNKFHRNVFFSRHHCEQQEKPSVPQKAPVQ